MAEKPTRGNRTSTQGLDHIYRHTPPRPTVTLTRGKETFTTNVGSGSHKRLLAQGWKAVEKVAQVPKVIPGEDEGDAGEAPTEEDVQALLEADPSTLTADRLRARLVLRGENPPDRASKPVLIDLLAKVEA